MAIPKECGGVHDEQCKWLKGMRKGAAGTVRVVGQTTVSGTVGGGLVKVVGGTQLTFTPHRSFSLLEYAILPPKMYGVQRNEENCSHSTTIQAQNEGPWGAGTVGCAAGGREETQGEKCEKMS